MDEIYDHFKKICGLLGDKVQQIITEPLFWVMVFLLLCCVVLAYSGASQGRLSSSIIGTLRQLGSFFIDTFNSIIQACKSLFGFLDVLKMLFFGHLNSVTLYVLTNYAIIFLSMASFSTTMQGLFSLIGWTGILISFGVQVMELVTTMGLIICHMPPKGKLKEMVAYAPYRPDRPDPYEHVKNKVESVLEFEENNGSATGGGAEKVAAGEEKNQQKVFDDPDEESEKKTEKKKGTKERKEKKKQNFLGASAGALRCGGSWRYPILRPAFFLIVICLMRLSCRKLRMTTIWRASI